jgi:hypothetical protein
LGRLQAKKAGGVSLQPFDDDDIPEQRMTLGIDYESMPTVAPAEPLMQILPADFPLPALTRFVPNPAIKEALDAAVAQANAVVVKEAGLEGLKAADAAIDVLHTAIMNAVDHFKEPADIAHRLHKSITSTRAEWVAAAEAAKNMIGNALYVEKERLEAIARAERRRQQEEADRLAREEAAQRLKDAEAQQAPAQVVEVLKEQAKTAVAQPVPTATPLVLGSTTTTTTWKARIKGTPADAEPNPEMAELSVAQWTEVQRLLRDIIDGKAPSKAIELNWSYLNDRAKGDGLTLAITGIEAFKEGGARAKGRRGKKTL